MTATPAPPSGPKPTWRERAVVLGGLGIALIATATLFAAGTGMHIIAPLWMAAIACTAAASVTGALWRGVRHGDRSAFDAYELPQDHGDPCEWSTRTGRYAYLQDWEDQLLNDDGHLHGHMHGHTMS